MENNLGTWPNLNYVNTSYKNHPNGLASVDTKLVTVDIINMDTVKSHPICSQDRPTKAFIVDQNLTTIYLRIYLHWTNSPFKTGQTISHGSENDIWTFFIDFLLFSCILCYSLSSYNIKWFKGFVFLFSCLFSYRLFV